MVDDGAGTRLTATWTEADGRPGHLDVFVALPEGHESLNVVIPWDDEIFNYTSKHQARPATGELVVGDVRHAIGARPAMRGACSMSAGADGRPRSPGTGVAGRAAAATMSSACSSGPSGPPDPATPRTASDPNQS
jgi:hypothetical protein